VRREGDREKNVFFLSSGGCGFAFQKLQGKNKVVLCAVFFFKSRRGAQVSFSGEKREDVKVSLSLSLSLSLS